MYGKNVAVMYGGGQIPSANIAIGMIIEKLLKRDLMVYGIHKSFMGLTDPSCYEEFNISKARKIQTQIGTYLSTCRNVNPAGNEWFPKIMYMLKSKGIKTIVILGGDGSSRAGKALLERAEKEGHNLQIIFIPCTIDGINGSDTIGIHSAVAESVRCATLIMANAFATWDPSLLGPRIAIVELMGRNRNDIVVNSMKQFLKMESIGKYKPYDIDFILIPSGHEWSCYELLKRVNSTELETVIIVSEGAKPIEPYWDNIIDGNSVGEKIKTLINQEAVRKANLDIIGYCAQTNFQVTDVDKKKIQEWTSFAAKTMCSTGESIAVIKKSEGLKATSLMQFASRNVSEKPVPLTDDEVKLLGKYLV